ncbi:hypothetical protein WMW72_27405 [Paenibacillus filicis]|uniref:Uncharacterized protein n=1 Tax=Paenibacillus filicis TaxID=669464 RepID=A0ABU9DV52_9BACL
MNKLEQLRLYEPYCYQVAYSLEPRESVAVRIACAALLSLYRNDRFFDLPDASKRMEIKRAVCRQMLQDRSRLLGELEIEKNQLA